MIAASPPPEDLRATSVEVKGELRSRAFFRRPSVSADAARFTHGSLAGLLGRAFGFSSGTAEPAVPSPARIQSP
jgi:hypothetical protein